MHGPMNVKFIVEFLILLMVQSWQSANVEGTIELIVLNKTAYDYTYLLTPWSRVLLEKLTSKLCS